MKGIRFFSGYLCNIFDEVSTGLSLSYTRQYMLSIMILEYYEPADRYQLI